MNLRADAVARDRRRSSRRRSAAARRRSRRSRRSPGRCRPSSPPTSSTRSASRRSSRRRSTTTASTARRIADSQFLPQRRLAGASRSASSASAPRRRAEPAAGARHARPRPDERLGRRQHAPARRRDQPRHRQGPRHVRRHVRKPGRERREQRHVHRHDRRRGQDDHRAQAVDADEGRHAGEVDIPLPDAADRDAATVRSRSRRCRGEQKTDNNTPELHGALHPMRRGAPASVRSAAAFYPSRRGRAHDDDRASSRWRRGASLWSRCLRLPCCACGCGGCGPPARPARRARRPDLVAHAARLERDFRSLHAYVDDVAARPRGAAGHGRGPPRRRDRLPRPRPLRRLQRDVRAPVDVDRAARRARLRHRLSSIHHRDQARFTPSRCVEGRGKLELSPEEHEAIRVALARESRPRRSALTTARARGCASAISGPRGRSADEALRGGARGDGDAASCRVRDDPRDGHGRPEPGRRPRARADRELARGRGQRDARRACARSREVAIVGETVLAIRNCLIARNRPALEAIEAVVSHPQPLGQCARFLRDALPQASVRATTSTADAVREVAATARRGPHSARGRPPRSTAARSCATASTTSPTTRRASCGSRARGTPPARRPAGTLEDVCRVRRRRRPVARLARALPERVRVPRREPDADRVAPAQAAASATTSSSSTSRAARRTPRSPTRSPPSAGTARRCACSVAIPRREAGLRPSPRRGPLHFRPGTPPWGAIPPGPVSVRAGHGHRPRGRDAGRVLVLNATFEPINVCSVRRAAVLLLKAKAELLEHATWELRSERTTMPRPVVIRLVTYVKVPRDTHRRKITRRAVFARDSWTCQYCGSRSNLTVDHVIPRSKGGVELGQHRRVARPATGARATICPTRPACTRAARRGAEPARLHPRRHPRRSPRRGGSGCRTRWA